MWMRVDEVNEDDDRMSIQKRGMASYIYIFHHSGPDKTVVVIYSILLTLNSNRLVNQQSHNARRGDLG